MLASYELVLTLLDLMTTRRKENVFSHLGKVFTGVTVPPVIDMMLDFESGSSLRF